MSGLFNLIPLIIIFPLIGVIINLAFGRKLMPESDSRGPAVVSTLMAALAFLIAVLQFVALLAHPEGAEVPFFQWFSIPMGERTLTVPWTFQVDTLSSVMMLVVTGVGTLIHIFASGYMHGDIDEQIGKRGLHDAEALDFKRRRYSRFFTYFSLFLTSMLILVTGNNYLMLFVGWELVGLCSFLLIGFWFDDPVNGVANSKAAAKAFIANRVGDFGMLMAIFLIFWSFGTLRFADVFERAKCMIDHGQAECLEVSVAAPVYAAAAEHGTEGEAAEGEEHAEEGAAEGEEHAEEGATEGEHAVGTLDTEIALGKGTLALGTVVTAITMFLLLGATGKSAQIPLFVWLPDAMAGPTPVSALIHAATMVTAGIYMITRSNVLFAMAPDTRAIVAIIGALTAFVAATIATGQYDIKKVLAYSTISQLGFMIAAAGLGGYVAAIFHLVTHAFFKALLFLGSGSVIHGMEHGHHAIAHGSHDAHEDEHHGDAHGGHDEHAFDPQDMRLMGGLAKHMPTTAAVYIIGSLALAGIFPLAGFWSKDEILLDALDHQNYLVLGLLMVAAFFTAFYMGRQVFMVFFGTPRTEAAGHAHESPPVMTYPLIALATLSVLGGLLNLPFPGTHNLAEWLHHSVENAHVPEGLSLNWGLAGLATLSAVIAIGLAWLLYGRSPLQEGERDPLTNAGPLFTFLNRKWYWDEVYNALIVQPYIKAARFLADVVDWRFWHDWFHDTIIADSFKTFAFIFNKGVDERVIDAAVGTVAELVGGTSEGMRRVQTGYVRNYALAVALGVVVILAFLAIQLF
jgi:NADH-quinone oxidoreductase subunit L